MIIGNAPKFPEKKTLNSEAFPLIATLQEPMFTQLMQ
jgi:hypothetical protein